MAKSKSSYRADRLVSVDFDGVLHEHAHYRQQFGEVDVDLIRRLHSAGFPVAVSTCNDLWRVAAALRVKGVEVWVDNGMTQMYWDGGRDGRTVLVTGRKVAAWKYIDDRNVSWHFGMNPREAVEACLLPAPARCVRCGAEAHYATSLDRPASRQINLRHKDGCDEKTGTHWSVA